MSSHGAPWSWSRGRSIPETAVVATLLVLLLWSEHARGGVTVAALGLGALFAGSIARRALVLRGRARPTPRVLFLLELAALAGVAVRPVPYWAHLIAALIALHHATVPVQPVDPEPPRASPLEEGFVVLVGAGASILAVALNPAWAARPSVLVTLGLLLVEAHGPRAPRSIVDAARRAAAFGVVGANLLLGDLVLGATLAVGLTTGLALARRALPPSEEDVLERLLDLGDREGRWWGRAALVALLGTILLATGTLHIRVRRDVDTAAMGSHGPHAFHVVADRAGLESVQADDAGHESTLEIFEDGRRLGPAHAGLSPSFGQGLGAYDHNSWGVAFSSSDQTDPRSNGRVYTLAYDWLPGAEARALIVLAAVLLNVRRLVRLQRWIETIHPAVAAGALLAIAGAFRLQVALRAPDLTFDGGIVKGMPFYDGQAWYEWACDFSRNEREWNALRPFHTVFLGSVLALTGPSVLVARATNVILSTLTTAVIFDAVRRASSPLAAVLAALTHALLLFDAQESATTMTEPLGALLATLSIWSLVRGIQAAAGTGGSLRLAATPFLASGVLLGLSNLTRPLTMGAVLGLPAALAIARPWWSLPRRRFVGAVAVFGAGFALAIGPWIARQRLVHGIWTVSDNTTAAFYAATSPELGTWSPAVEQLAGVRTIAERSRFFMDAANRNLRDHTGWYLGHVLDHLRLAAEATAPPAWAFVALGACLLARALGRKDSPRRPLVVAGAALLAATWLPAAPRAALGALAFLHVAVRREPESLFTGLQLPTLVSIATIAMSGMQRLTHGLQWVTCAVVTASLVHAVASIEGEAPPSRAWPGESWGRAGRVAGAAAVLALALVAAGLGRALTATPGPKPPRDEPSREPWLAKTLEADARFSPGDFEGRLVVRRAKTSPGFLVHLEAREAVRHGCPLFAPRAYEFTIFKTEPPTPESCWAVVPGRLPAIEPAAELLLVGLSVTRPEGGPSLELVALGVLGPGGEPRWHRPDPEAAREHSRHLASQLEATRRPK